MNYDIIIPTAKKDIQFIPTVICYLKKYLTMDYIYIITNKKYINSLEKKIVLKQKVIIIDENNLIEGLSFQAVSDYLASYNIHQGAGWYFQQFLKLGFALSKYCHGYYLSWDADTLPLSPIQFFTASGKPIFTIKKEYHPPYFETLKHLLNLKKEVPYSFIAEHMVFKDDIVKLMLKKIKENNLKGKDWIENIIISCGFKTWNKGYNNLFSEFETYGTFCSTYYPNFYTIQKLNTFRGAGMIRGRYITPQLIERLSWDLDTASFEEQDAPFPWNINYRFNLYSRKIKTILCHPLSTIKKLRHRN